MTIPGRGDLAPPRRHSSLGRWFVTVLVLALLAGGGYAAFLGLSGGSSKSAAPPLALCPAPGAVAAAQKIGPLRLSVMNATDRNGLAASVAADLQTRGFHVVSIGNAVLMQDGVAVVRYPTGRRLVADKVAAQIKGATIVSEGGHGIVELDLGPQFKALATPAQAKRAYARKVPTPSPSPTPTGSCRPRG